MEIDHVYLTQHYHMSGINREKNVVKVRTAIY